MSLVKQLTEELFTVLNSEMGKPENKSKLKCCIDPIFIYIQSYIQPYFLLLIAILSVILVLNIVVVVKLFK